MSYRTILFLLILLSSASNLTTQAAEIPKTTVTDYHLSDQSLWQEHELGKEKESECRLDNAGIDFAKKILPSIVFKYITQMSKRVAPSTADKLDALFSDKEIQRAFAVLEKDADNVEAKNILAKKGFTLVQGHHIFKHALFEKKFFKIANSASGKFAYESLAGRIWFGDAIRVSSQVNKWNISVPAKAIHFMRYPMLCKSLYMIVMAAEEDLTGMKELSELSPSHVEYIRERLDDKLSYPDSIETNVVGREGSNHFIVLDSETLTMNFEAIFADPKLAFLRTLLPLDISVADLLPSDD
ncbi:MAG TPA: hypothetical protein VFF04_01385 [Candidatus Babeliales bacterium]|nr:hypothetical protein [Candidatus Babeliales bacterium]